ncbi:MAG: glycosyltransferase [Candidatus Eisenbacteria bacterium]|nr:glycosyltransferase [Candidatus Eisenbacteria bacterium]
MKPKILHTMTWLAPGGGVDNNVYLTLRELRRDYECHLLVGAEIHHNPFRELGDVRVIICPHMRRSIHLWDDLRSLLFLYRLIRRERYVLVHTHESKASLLTRVAARLAGCPAVIFGLHGVNFNDPHSRLRRWAYLGLERLTVPFSHVIVSVSRDAVDAYHQAGIGRGIPYRVIHSGVDLDQFRNPADRGKGTRQQRRRLGLEEDDLVLINVGRFSPAKAQRYTIEAFARLRRKHDGLRLLLVGEGEEMDACRELARRLGTGDSVIFMGSTRDVAGIFSLADIHVLTSLREGLPRVAVEAALCGVPTVAFEVEGIREIINHGVSGAVVPRYDVDALCRRVEELLEDHGKRRRYAAAAGKAAVEGWDHRRMVSDLRALYAELQGAAS